MNPHAERYCPTTMLDRLPQLSVADGHPRFLFLHTLLRSAARCVIFVAGLILIASQAVYADTTWVAGAVSGTWTAAGSPYVIVDSCWVAPEDELTVLPGVEVLLPDSTSRLMLQGSCRFLGTPNDSVVIRQLGLRSQIQGYYPSPAPVVVFSYTVFAGYTTVLIEADSVHYDHCGYEDPPGGGDASYIESRGRFARLTHSRVHTLSMMADSAVVEDVEFQWTLGTSDAGVLIDNVRGSDENSQLGISVFMVSRRVVLRNVSVSRLMLWLEYAGSSQVTVDQCNIVSELDIPAASLPLAFHQTVTDHLRVGQSNTAISGLVVTGGAQLWGSSVVNFINCTFHQRNQNRSSIRTFIDLPFRDDSVSFLNCVFQAEDPYLTILPNDRQALASPSRYNLTHGMFDPWGTQPLGPGNINADPRFDPNSEEYVVTFNSPCINAGDPALTDPDGSRSDIGAFWWDHRFNHAPVITTPANVTVGWGEPFTLALTYADDGPATFSYPVGEPSWLFRRRALDDASLILYSGRIPFGTSSFTLPLTLSDAAGQQDHETLQVTILPTYTLHDTLSGRLPSEYSPYLITNDVVIARGDSLSIDSGCKLLVDSAASHVTITVAGALAAMGGVGDSILFGSVADHVWNGIELRDSAAVVNLDYCRFQGTRRSIWVEHGEGLKVEHTSFESTQDGDYELYLEGIRDSLILRSNSFVGSHRLYLLSTRFAIDSCSFLGSPELYAVFTDKSDGRISNCTFRNTVGQGVAITDSCTIGLSDNVFLAGFAAPCVSITMPSLTSLRNNTFLGPSVEFIAMSDGNTPAVYPATTSIVNNLFMGGDRSALSIWGEIDTLVPDISHNCFWNCSEIWYHGDTIWPGMGELAGVNINGDSVDAYMNLVADPLFVDSLGHLSAGSPCIDAGIDVGLPFTGTAPDIGRWEYNGESGHPELTAARQNPSSHTLAVLYPNPTNGQVTLLLAISGECEIMIYDLLGRSVLTTYLQATHDGNVHLDITELPSGRYFMRLESERRLDLLPLVVLK
jgi:hypothetical protein